MNVYVLESARQLVRCGVEVEIYTRRTAGVQRGEVELEPGLLVRHIDAGPYEGLSKDDLPGQLCAFTAGVMQIIASRPPGWFDVVHSHYWLSGQVGWLVAERWQIPLVHSMHTMARVKNAGLAAGDVAEPPGREIGEQQVVDVAGWLVANTDGEREQLIRLYGADPARVRVIPPGVDLDVFGPVSAPRRAALRAERGLDDEQFLVLFVGRLQALKGPQVLIDAIAGWREHAPELLRRTRVVMLGAASGSGLADPQRYRRSVDDLGLGDTITLLPPVPRAELADWYRSADTLVVPSHNESFGLVAVEAGACGTPTVAARVGGLPKAVGDGGVLVDGHDPRVWGAALADLLRDEPRRHALSAAAVQHASGLGWDRTAHALLELYGTARRGEAGSG